MSKELNKVETTVKIAGRDCFFVNLLLSQGFNRHHHFDITVNHEELDEKWMGNPVKMIKLIGEKVNITMMHRTSGEQTLFEGFITNVSFSGSHGQQNDIIISGSSNTIRLDGKNTMDSFMDKPLKQVVEEVVANSGNDGEVISKPVYTQKLDYLCQYGESCFDFLNRLSWLYGEWFFSDGINTYFGKPELDDPVEIIYDVHMTEFDLKANLVPPKFNRFQYLVHDDNEIKYDAPPEVNGVRGYLQASLGRSDKIYTSKANLPLEAVVATKKDLEDMVEVEKSRSVGNMLVMSGKTQTCRVKLGQQVKIKFPETMEVDVKEVDTFLVTEVIHIVDQKGHYHNSFTGILSEIDNIPMKPAPAPIANPQIAWVKSNADDRKLGRVKVQFQWQKMDNKTTNWIRVQTPDAGSSGKVLNNRGFVFIPENGDQVMIGFEYGDPNRPYVAGSIFSEKVGAGGGDTNKSKSLTTRSGSTVTLNDEDGSVLIADQTGNDTIIIDGKDKISVTTTKTIELFNGKSCIVLEEENILIKATNIMIDGSAAVVMCNGDSEMVAVTTEGDANVTIGGPIIAIGADDKMTVGAINTIDLNSIAVTMDGSATFDITGGLVKINS